MAVCNVCALDKGVCSMIEMKDVSFCYAQSDTESLCGVNLSIADGECILLCGKSGCGKTSGFTQEDLSESGKWVYEMLRK